MNKHYSIGEAMQQSDWDWMAGWVSGRFDVSVGPDWCKDATRLIRNIEKNNWLGWSDGSWAMWWKNRVDQAGLLKPGSQSCPEINLTVELHMGFLSVEETEEQLSRLHQNEAKSDPPGPVTPGIVRTQVVVRPIDRVAARVVPGGQG